MRCFNELARIADQFEQLATTNGLWGHKSWTSKQCAQTGGHQVENVYECIRGQKAFLFDIS